MRPGTARAWGLLAGYAADRVLGDPRRFHPVAGFGQVAGAVERRLYADSRTRGVVSTATLVGGAVTFGAAAEACARHVGGPHARTAVSVLRRTGGTGLSVATGARRGHAVSGGSRGRVGGSVEGTRRWRGIATAALTAVATWAVLGGRSLEREALAVHAHLTADDLPAARKRLTHLVGRDTAVLDESEVSRAVIESLAENTSDAVVAPLVWGAIAGIPGLLGYRAINTLDAMIGHHTTRYEHFGWAAARLDDLVNLPGSRLAGLLALAADPRRAREAWRAWRRDASAHPSPNAGVIEAAFAGSLGIRLGGVNTYYGSRVEHRAVMGDGRPATPADIATAVRLARRVDLGAAAVSAGAAVTLARLTARRRSCRS